MQTNKGIAALRKSIQDKGKPGAKPTLNTSKRLELLEAAVAELTQRLAELDRTISFDASHGEPD